MIFDLVVGSQGCVHFEEKAFTEENGDFEFTCKNCDGVLPLNTEEVFTILEK